MSLDLLPEGRFDVSNISAFDVFGSELLLSTYGPIPAEGLHDCNRSERESSSTITQEYRSFSTAASRTYNSEKRILSGMFQDNKILCTEDGRLFICTYINNPKVNAAVMQGTHGSGDMVSLLIHKSGDGRHLSRRYGNELLNLEGFGSGSPYKIRDYPAE